MPLNPSRFDSLNILCQEKAWTYITASPLEVGPDGDGRSKDTEKKGFCL
jgi:hypothetical protein